MDAAPGDCYCTLLMNDGYLPGAAVLAHSLRDAGTSKKLAVMITPDTLHPTTLAALNDLYDHVIPVERLSSSNVENLHRLDRLDLQFAFTKIALWQQTAFRRIVYVDADVVALRAPDELFDLEDRFAAAPDTGWPDIFNSGVMLLAPSLAEHRSLCTLAASGTSFDGADQGLLNQYFAGRPWRRLSFTYNCTPSASYQYEPAYRHFGSSVSMVHFIGREKPWTSGRRGLAGAGGAYRELLGKWWSVYDRHYKAVQSSSALGAVAPAQHTVQKHVKGELDTIVRPFVPSLPAPPPIAVHAPAEPEQPVDLAPPVAHVREAFVPPVMEWDATKNEPPLSSKPEASSFPAQKYVMSQDHNLFKAPREYPEAPKDMYYQVPETRPGVGKPRPIFPWESQARAAPTRVFAEDEPQPPLYSPGAAAPSADPAGPASAAAPAAPVQPASPSDPWRSFSRTNAWDDDASIDKYVRALSSHHKYRGPVQVLPQQSASATTHPSSSSSAARQVADPTVTSPPIEPRRRGSLILTDFPSAVERPSLPVTPAPIHRSTFWGAGEGAEPAHLPGAAGVPHQAEWNPTERLEELRRASMAVAEEDLPHGVPEDYTHVPPATSDTQSAIPREAAQPSAPSAPATTTAPSTAGEGRSAVRDASQTFVPGVSATSAQSQDVVSAGQGGLSKSATIEGESKDISGGSRAVQITPSVPQTSVDGYGEAQRLGHYDYTPGGQAPSNTEEGSRAQDSGKAVERGGILSGVAASLAAAITGTAAQSKAEAGKTTAVEERGESGTATRSTGAAAAGATVSSTPGLSDAEQHRVEQGGDGVRSTTGVASSSTDQTATEAQRHAGQDRSNVQTTAGPPVSTGGSASEGQQSLQAERHGLQSTATASSSDAQTSRGLQSDTAQEQRNVQSAAATASAASALSSSGERPGVEQDLRRAQSTAVAPSSSAHSQSEAQHEVEQESRQVQQDVASERQLETERQRSVEQYLKIEKQRLDEGRGGAPALTTSTLTDTQTFRDASGAAAAASGTAHPAAAAAASTTTSSTPRVAVGGPSQEQSGTALQVGSQQQHGVGQGEDEVLSFGIRRSSAATTAARVAASTGDDQTGDWDFGLQPHPSTSTPSHPQYSSEDRGGEVQSFGGMGGGFSSFTQSPSFASQFSSSSNARIGHEVGQASGEGSFSGVQGGFMTSGMAPPSFASQFSSSFSGMGGDAQQDLSSTHGRQTQGETGGGFTTTSVTSPTFTSQFASSSSSDTYTGQQSGGETFSSQTFSSQSSGLSQGGFATSAMSPTFGSRFSSAGTGLHQEARQGFTSQTSTTSSSSHFGTQQASSEERGGDWSFGLQPARESTWSASQAAHQTSPFEGQGATRSSGGSSSSIVQSIMQHNTISGPRSLEFSTAGPSADPFARGTTEESGGMQTSSESTSSMSRSTVEQSTSSSSTTTTPKARRPTARRERSDMDGADEMDEYSIA